MSESVAVVLRLALAAIFSAAGIAKLRDRPGTAAMLTESGVPERLVAAGALALPAIELATALLLVPSATAWFGAVLALVLLVVFSAVVAFHLWRGHSLNCNCFGQIAQAPVSPATLGRNAIFAAMTLGVLFPPDLNGVLAQRDALMLAFAALVIVTLTMLTFMLFQIIRQQGRILLAIEVLSAAANGTAGRRADPPRAAIGPGQRAPNFTLRDAAGSERSLGDMLQAGRPMLLVLSNPDCGPCEALLPELVAWHRDHSACLAVVAAMERPKGPDRHDGAAGSFVLRQRDREVSAAYGAAGTPAAVLIHPDGTLGSSLAMGAEAIRSLLINARQNLCADRLRSSAPVPIVLPRLGLGQAAPNLALERLDGTQVRLHDFVGRPRVLLFWNSRCGYCRDMQDELLAWESRVVGAIEVADRLLVVAAGDRDSNLPWLLRAPLLLDGQGRAAAQFGVTGTPTALLIDAQCRVASPPAAGARAAFVLLEQVEEGAVAR